MGCLVHLVWGNTVLAGVSTRSCRFGAWFSGLFPSYGDMVLWQCPGFKSVGSKPRRRSSECFFFFDGIQTPYHFRRSSTPVRNNVGRHSSLVMEVLAFPTTGSMGQYSGEGSPEVSMHETAH